MQYQKGAMQEQKGAPQENKSAPLNKSAPRVIVAPNTIIKALMHIF